MNPHPLSVALAFWLFSLLSPVLALRTHTRTLPLGTPVASRRRRS